jgi:tRNA-dependent cyclodipeptide synthase
MSYKVKPAKIQAKYHFDIKNTTHNKCFLGISIDAPFIGGKHVERVLQWIDTNFQECLIIIGDDVHLYNEFIFGNSEQEARNKCKKLGQFAESKLKEGLGNLSKDKFKIRHWDSYTSNTEFISINEQYKKLFEEDSKFHSLIIACAKSYLKKQKEKGNYSIVSEEEALKHSVEYIIEEMTVFSILINQGYSTLVYPGTILQIFKDIVQDVFPKLDSVLKKGIYIDLTIKKN